MPPCYSGKWGHEAVFLLTFLSLFGLFLHERASAGNIVSITVKYFCDVRSSFTALMKGVVHSTSRA